MKNMLSGKTRTFLRIAAGAVAAFLLLVAATPGRRPPGVYVRTRHRVSRHAVLTGRTSAQAPAPGELVHLNTAEQEDLERLDGIGAALAEAIVAYRTAHGPFQSVEELTRVEGIGAGTLESIRPYITVE